MRGFFLQLMGSAAVVATAASAHAGSYVYTPIVVGTNVPLSTNATGINESDTVVGTHTFAIPTKKPGHYKIGVEGFVWRNGTVTIFGAPAGATFVESGRINRFGIALAHDTLADGTPGSYTYDTTSGATQQLSVPGATRVDAAWISKAGAIAGSVAVAGSTVSHSFVIKHGVATIFDPPGALSSYAGFVGADGTVSGTFYTSDPKLTSGYIYKNGVFTILNSPFGTPFDGYAETSAGYVSADGAVLGAFFNGIEGTGYVYKDGAYTSLAFGPSSFPYRILKDGRTFGEEYGTNDNAYVVGGNASGNLLPPGVFTLIATDVTATGDFVGSLEGVDQNSSDVYYETFIATCPAGQAPCG